MRLRAFLAVLSFIAMPCAEGSTLHFAGGFTASNVASTLIAYDCINGSVSSICTYDTATATNTLLTNTACNDVNADWSYDGTQIAFQRECGNNSDIFRMNADGSGVTQVTSGEHLASLPTWAPNGQIVYTQLVHQAGPTWCPSTAPTNPLGLPCDDLRVINADGTGDTELLASSFTNGGATILTAISPHVSPDGTTIMFGVANYLSGWGGAGLQLATIPFAPGSVTQVPTVITNVNPAASDPSYSLSKVGGQYLILSSSIQSGNSNVWRWNADGTGATQLTTFVQPEQGQDAGYNATLTKIVFEHDFSGGAADVSIMNADGSNEHTLGIACAGQCKPRFQPIFH